MSISLISVPLVLSALGASDYGLYNLVAGVVAMLSFLNLSLTVSSQRYMSVAMGAKDIEGIDIVYNTSFYMHLFLGAIIIVLFEFGSFFIDKLNIEPDRLWCAKIIYQFLIISTFVQIISVPFDALINAHEDMHAFAIIETINSLLLLVVAISLKYYDGDKLLFYGLFVCFIAIATFLMKYGWVRYSYRNYRINIVKKWSKLQIRGMFGFAGWNLFGGIAMIGRNQGIAIIFNIFLGTIANASYGIANHINGALSNFSGTFQKAINPQLMKSEGMKDRERLLKISFISSKYSVLALSFFSIPLIIEMPDILHIWLNNNIPPYTIELTRYILLLSIVYQYSVGIMSAIQAVGYIRNYQIAMGCIILLNLPMAYILVKTGYPIYYVTIGFVALELISLVVRIKMAEVLVKMPPVVFIKEVVIPTLIIIIPSAIFCLIPYIVISSIWLRFIFVSLAYCSLFFILFWLIALDENMKRKIIDKLSF